MATLTVYPDPGTGATTVDGQLGRSAYDTWANQVAAATADSVGPTVASGAITYGSTGSSSGQFRLYRAAFLFDTSGLTSGATISAATFSIYGSGAASSVGQDYINVYSSNPASNNNLVAGDYSTLGSTAFSTHIGYSPGWSTSGYNNFVLNASGLAAISKTGVSKFGCRCDSDVSGTSLTWMPSASNYVLGYFADQTGTTTDPKLVVTYTTSSGLTISVSDAISIAENVAASLATVRLTVSVSEAISIAENLHAPVTPFVARVNEAISLVESLTAELKTIRLTAAVSDAITVLENVAGQLTTVNQPNTSVSEAISVVENITAQLRTIRLNASVNEAITVSEDVNVLLNTLGAISASVNDVITLTESIKAVLTPLVARPFEAITVADVAIVSLSGGGIPAYSYKDNLMLDSLNNKVIILETPTLPIWNTAGRPSNPKAGQCGFNSQTNALEVYDGSTWH